MCFKPRSEIKQQWSHFISREMLNLLWNLKQNISNLINQNKLWAVCTIQILGICVAWGWGSPPTWQKQQVLERWQYLRCRAQAGLSHWPLLHVVLVPPVPLSLLTTNSYNLQISLSLPLIPSSSRFQRMPKAALLKNSGGVWGQVPSSSTAHLSCHGNWKGH